MSLVGEQQREDFSLAFREKLENHYIH